VAVAEGVGVSEGDNVAVLVDKTFCTVGVEAFVGFGAMMVLVGPDVIGIVAGAQLLNINVNKNKRDKALETRIICCTL
jgi:hypothetical protein